MTLPDHLILDCHIQFREGAKLPDHLYSAFRGAFGHALKQVSCLYLAGNCGSCEQKAVCDYSYIFATPVRQETEFYQAGEYAPHPYVLTPPLENKNQFSITLFGDAIEKWKTVVRAVHRMGQLGISRERYQFSLISVMAGDETVWHSQRPNHFVTPETASYRQRHYPNEIAVDFITPAQIKVNDKLIKAPDFAQVIQVICRRLKSLLYWHTGEYKNFDIDAFLQAAGDVRTIKSNTRWQKISRFSNRQQSKMSFATMLGTMTYAGNFAAFAELLAFAEVAHIGKKTTFGFGKIKVRQ